MRKRVHEQAASPEPNWLRVEDLAEVSVSSEDANGPIEFALVPAPDLDGERRRLANNRC